MSSSEIQILPVSLAHLHSAIFRSFEPDRAGINVTDHEGCTGDDLSEPRISILRHSPSRCNGAVSFHRVSDSITEGSRLQPEE